MVEIGAQWGPAGRLKIIGLSTRRRETVQKSDQFVTATVANQTTESPQKDSSDCPNRVHRSMPIHHGSVQGMFPNPDWWDADDAISPGLASV
ncbi:hypothetical protein RB5523 [Rhodopirellula baltica SH 1]|uniref:Uncharacterized protein n=1 Tax=Rhodopirellula baltica (strain DSM 10527 / NCIMB 13988 / SH1) TaxID=243090 RepID=Q7URP7_RHOBA|nr:hypothetical protein RB5523 [Rhodopirellula baltica SH 1]